MADGKCVEKDLVAKHAGRLQGTTANSAKARKLDQKRNVSKTLKTTKTFDTATGLIFAEKFPVRNARKFQRNEDNKLD